MARGEGIKKLNSLFEKYKKTLIAPQGTIIVTFCEVVEELLGIKVDKKIVRYSTSTRILSIQGGGPLKSEIKLREAEILAHIKGRVGEKNGPIKII